MHAGWNLLARRQCAEVTFIGRMLVVTVVVLFAPAVTSEILTRSITPLAWACVLGSGACCGVYYYSLARAYNSSEFTVVYPVARSLPVVLVALGDVLRGRPLTSAAWIGAALVVAGCVLAPLHSFREFSLGRYFHRASFWMGVTALGTVGYTLLDKVAQENVRFGGPATAFRYSYMFFLVSWAAYWLARLGLGKPPECDEPVGWKTPVLGAVFNFGGYTLVVWSYQLARHASYIVAFRQASIIIGVALAFLIYRERGLLVRITGTLIITAGLVLIALRGG